MSDTENLKEVYNMEKPLSVFGKILFYMEQTKFSTFILLRELFLFYGTVSFSCIYHKDYGNLFNA